MRVVILVYPKMLFVFMHLPWTTQIICTTHTRAHTHTPTHPHTHTHSSLAREVHRCQETQWSVLECPDGNKIKNRLGQRVKKKRSGIEEEVFE